MTTPVNDWDRLEAVWSEARKVRASCVAHHREVRWEPAPEWWRHSAVSTCCPLLSAPAPIPRDKPFRSGPYGEQDDTGFGTKRQEEDLAMSSTMTLGHGDVDTGFPVPSGNPEPGDWRCGFPGPEIDCHEIPVAVLSETCACGSMELLPACQQHAEEVAAWADDADRRVLTCLICGRPLSVVVTWDDIRPVAVLQAD